MTRMLGAVLAALVLAACSGAGTGAGDARSVFDLSVGDCFDDPAATAATEVRVVDCAEPHDNEVFAVVQHPGGPDAPFPGSEAMTTTADELCRAPFGDYVERSYEESRMYLLPVTPSGETWAQGDREIICALYEPDGGKIRGTRRGSAV